MTAVGTCDRLPCDSAYSRRGHRPDEDGDVIHFVSAGGSSSEGWRVAIMAAGDGDWRVVVDLDGSGYVPIMPDARQGIGRSRETPRRASNDALENAIKLSNAIATAAAYMAATL